MLFFCRAKRLWDYWAVVWVLLGEFGRSKSVCVRLCMGFTNSESMEERRQERLSKGEGSSS